MLIFKNQKNLFPHIKLLKMKYPAKKPGYQPFINGIFKIKYYL